MEFLLLGPLEVIDDDGRSVDLGPLQERALLAVLLLSLKRVVPLAEIVEGLWGERPPTTAANDVQGYVSRLRGALGHGARIETVAPGYRLEAEAEALDLVRFERSVAEGGRALSRGDATRAAALLEESLALYRGVPLAEFSDLPFAQPAGARWERLMRTARTDWAAARLELGEHEELAPELERMVADDRFNEQLYRLLMTALHRAGRQADALAVYQRARRTLVEELGVEPGPELRQFEAQVLRQELAAPPVLPRGLVTFLLTDVEGSTRLWEGDRPGMADALAHHDGIVAEVVQSHFGLLRKSRGEGDSTFSVFGRASDGVAAALVLQRALRTTAWPGSVRLAVRAAVHTGEAELRDGDYYGPTVNRAARVRSAAHGGQVLVTEPCAALVRDSLPEGAALIDLGYRQLADLERPERLCLLVHPDLPAGPPTKLRGEGRVELPARLTSFVGREQELEDVARVLGGSRLVTLTGPGGCGKTSLGVEAARSAAPMYPDGVWFVDLVPLAADALVPAAIAGVLGLRQEPGRPFADTVCEYLSSRHALVMLDNCEHLADGAGAIVDQLLRAAPGVRVLATSRERLGVPGETAWTVPPLAEPDAVRLFVDRARSAAPAASVDGDPAVIEVCRRLDGVPLAIELAAARASVLSVGQIASRLDDALRLLGEASRTAPLRQRTLRATIEWSYELLTGTERALFDRLAVFPGGFTLEAAEVVGACPELAAPDVLDCFARLAAKSLVLLQAGEGGTLRYRLLETLRQYGTSRLVVEDRLAGARGAHAAYYLTLAEEEAPGLHRPGSGDCLRRLASEADNFRTALEWAFAEPLRAEAGRAETGCRLVAALAWSWFVEGRIAEGRSWADLALAATENQPTFLRGSLFLSGSLLAGAHSDIAAYAAHAEDALRLGAELDSPVLRAGGAHFLAVARWAEGDLARARELLHEAIEGFEHATEGRHPTVSSEFPGAFLGPWRMVLGVLGRLLNDAGDASEASEALSRARTLARDQGEDLALAFSLDVSAALALDRGDTAESASLIDEAVHHYREGGWLEGLASGLNTQGLVALSAGAAATAQASFGEALGLCRRLGHLGGLATALEGLASVAAIGGEAHLPATLLGAAAPLRARSGAEIPAHLQPAHNRLRAQLAERLGDDEFAAAWKAGDALGPDAAVELAGRADAVSGGSVDA